MIKMPEVISMSFSTHSESDKSHPTCIWVQDVRYVPARTAEPTPLNHERWDMLVQVERRLYRDGGLGITDVESREDSGWLMQLWDIALIAVENTANDDGTGSARNNISMEYQAAKRVAQALMLLNFGAESLLR